MAKSERILFWCTAALSLAIRVLALFRYRFDSDEQQHLHVAWGWTAGLVQYRDLFDNHLPLFHMLTAPILALAGERSDILLWMRLPMLVLFVAVLWATFAIARDVWDARIAAWAVVLLSLFPPFFLKSLEFRNDNLWNALWMLAVAGLVLKWRPFLIGLLLGTAMASSVKTLLLIVAIVIAAVVMRLFRKTTWNGRQVLEAVIGFALVPLALGIYFVSAGAWDELVFCNFTFNTNLTLTRKYWIGRALFPFMLAGLLWVAWRFRRTENTWRYFFAAVMGAFTITLFGFWILISPRDFLPLMPLAAMFAAAHMRRLRSFAIIVAICVASLWYYADRFENKTDWHTTMLDQALRLTRPGEMLIDSKGETIYRRRPFYFAFENITRAQMAKGIIRDTLPEDVIRTRTHVAQADGPMWPPRGRAFLSENFLDMGRLRASGQWIREDGTFTIAVPGEYVIINERGEARGSLDGRAYIGARELRAGPHRFERAMRGEKVAVLWAPAFRRGHSPFHHRDRDF